jgi:hypothetical protein
VLLHFPHAHPRLTGLSEFLRSQSSLPKKLQERALVPGNYASLALLVNSFDGETCPRI